MVTSAISPFVLFLTIYLFIAFTNTIFFSPAYESCAELLNAGFKKSGIHLIKPFQTDMFNVSCDQTSSGGGISANVLNRLTVKSTLFTV